MALQFPKGLFNVGIELLDGTGEPGTLIDGFYPRSLNPSYASDTASIEGGDTRLEEDTSNDRYDMTLQTAGLALAAIAAMEGTTVVTTGTGSTLVNAITKNVTDGRPAFRLRAQQRDKTGGVTEYVFPKVSAVGSPTLTGIAQNTYLTPDLPLQAVPATEAQTGPPVFAEGDLYAILQLATFAALS